MNVLQSIDARAREWFVRLDTDDASEADWLAFQDWLEADDRHRQAYDRVELLWITLDDAPTSRIPANDYFARRRPAWLAPVIGLAATVVVAIGAGSLFIPAGVETYQADTAPRTLELADGSTIHLNRHSLMSVRLRKGRREVTLKDGEAAFDVAHDASRPFVITASGRTVEVLGTAFNVVNHDGRFSVGVSRGLVSVTPAGGRPALRLGVGQRVEQHGEGLAVTSRIDPAAAASWREGVLVYRDAPLAEVGEDLSRYLNRPVTTAASAQNLLFSGVLNVADEKLVLQQLQELAPVRVDRTTSGVEIAARDAH